MSDNSLTLSSENAATFVCPIFNVETKMSACMKLRTLVWGGDTPNVRRGCQACMMSGKCPAAAMAERICRIGNRKEYSDFFSAPTPSTIKLGRDILERIRPVIVQDYYLRQKNVPDNERMLIASANERIDKQLSGAPVTGTTKPSKASKPVKRAETQAPIERTPKPESMPVVDPSILSAAASGDMAAALNQ